MFNTYMGMLVWPMIAMGWVVNLMQRGTASWERITQLMSESPAITAHVAWAGRRWKARSSFAEWR